MKYDTTYKVGSVVEYEGNLLEILKIGHRYYTVADLNTSSLRGKSSFKINILDLEGNGFEVEKYS